MEGIKIDGSETKATEGEQSLETRGEKLKRAEIHVAEMFRKAWEEI